MKKLDRLTEASPAVRDNREAILELQDELKRRKQGSFAPPTPQDVEEYARFYATKKKGVNGNIDGEKFCDFYKSKGWKIGKTLMKDWRAAARRCICDGWARRIASDRSLDAKKLRDKARADGQVKKIREDWTGWLMDKDRTKEGIELRIKSYPPMRWLAYELRPDLMGVAKENKDDLDGNKSKT